MKNRLILVLVCLAVLSGCSATARFYPVQGPLATQTPSPVYVAKLSDGLTSGNLSVVLSGGEICKGRWSQVPRPNTPRDVTATPSAPANSLSAEWDTVYGTGFYVAHVLGARLYARAVLTGNLGTTLHVELYKPDIVEKNPTPAAIKGVAKDDKGNIYKVAF